MTGISMRQILILVVMVALGLPGVVHAQENPGVLEMAEGKDGGSLSVTSVLLFGRCKVILPGWDWRGGYRTFLHERSSWSGPCDEQGLANGTGVLILCEHSNVSGADRCYRSEGTIVSGLWQGRVKGQFTVDGPLVWRVFKDGCDKERDYCDPAPALRIQARYLAGASTGGSRKSVASQRASGPLPKLRGQWGNPCLKVDELQRNRIRHENGAIYDVINFVLRNNCSADQLYYLEFAGGSPASWTMQSGSDYSSPDFTNRAFQQKWIAAGEGTPNLAGHLGWGWRYLQQPPANMSALSRGWLKIAGKGEFYAMEVAAGKVDDINDPYWRSYEYIITSCDATKNGHKVDMFFNPDKGYFACLPITFDPVK